MNGLERVVLFIQECHWEALPSSVQHQIKLALLDDLGATLSGTLTRISHIATDYAVETWPGDEATILLHDRRVSAIGAAFANGYAANGLDIDSCGRYTRGHPGAQIFPTALAMAEKLGADGPEMMAAMVVGYEVAHRTARCWHDHHLVYQACGSWGSVACAAVAANLLRLSEEEIENALGIAEYHAPNLPMMREIDNPTMVKHGIGWGAMTGIAAAGLAARGFTAIPSLLSFERYKGWVADIGQRYIMLKGIAWKEYACCAWAHAALDAARGLMHRHNIPAEEIAHIRVEVFHEAFRLGTELPSTTEEAQFNLAWPLAVLLLDEEVGPQQILENRLGDEQVRDLASKVELIESEEFNDLYSLASVGDPRGAYVSAVTITLKDGRQFASGVVEGGIKFPQGWNEEQVERKFRWLAGFVLDKARVDKLVDMVWNFEDVSDMRELSSLGVHH